jgi:hypothetical protein
MDFEVSVRPFSREALDTFLQIERPGSAAGPSFVERMRSPLALLPGYVDDEASELHFYSIGEFYAEIDRGLHRLHDEFSARGEELFVGDPTRQVTPDFEYQGGGEVIAVTDLASADLAIRLICEQGEGLGGAIYDEEGELSHYYRFEQIILGRYYLPGDEPGKPTGQEFQVDWSAVHPVTVDARFEHFSPTSKVHADAREFSRSYQDFLAVLTRAHNGDVKLLDDAVIDMFRLKGLAMGLVSTPLDENAGAHAAPVFGVEF